MSSDERIKRGGGIRFPMLLMGVVMIAAFFGLGFYILLNPSSIPVLAGEVPLYFCRYAPDLWHLSRLADLLGLFLTPKYKKT